MKKSELLREFPIRAKEVGLATQTASPSSLGDFLLHQNAGSWELKIIVKSIWWAERSLLAQNIWIAFPDGGNISPLHWYVVPHDVIVAHGKIKHKNTLSWKKGLYHKPRLSKDDIEAYEQYKIEALAGYEPKKIKKLLSENARTWE
jgi:hypothetical protein